MKKLILSSVLVATMAMFPFVIHGEAASNSSIAQAANQAGAINADNVNIRKGAGTTYPVVTKFSKGKKVEITGSSKNSNGETWYSIKFDGKSGWVISKYVSRTLTSTKTEIKKYMYVQKNSPVYNDPAVKQASIVSLAENEKVAVLNEQNGWLYIETTKGIQGWVSKSSTSTVLFRRLVSPQVTTSGKNTYVSWTKQSYFNFSYSTSGNQLVLSKGFTDVSLPTSKIKGIKQIKTVQVSSTEKSVNITFEPGYTFTIRNYSNKVSIKVIPTGLLGKKIIVDAGHGGKDTGAIGPIHLKEKDVNLGTALLLKNELEKAGAIVTLTRSTDIFLELAERTAIANSSDYDAFVSLHCDSFSKTSKGTTTYFNTSVNFNGPKSKQLATFVEKSLVSSINTYNKGVKEQEFYVNRMNALPSILVEMAYISNPNEEKLLKSTAFRQKVVQGIRKGFEAYFNSL